MILQVFTHVSNNAEKFRKSGIEDLTSTVYIYIHIIYTYTYIIYHISYIIYHISYIIYHISYIYITCTCWLESLSPAISSSTSLRGSKASGRRSEVAETVKSWVRPANFNGECGEYVTLTSIYGNFHGNKLDYLIHRKN